MRSILEEKFNKYIKNEFVYDFDISETGLYVIEISSQAKDWLRNTLKFISFFQDDDLAVKIDNGEFPKLNGKRGLFDSEAAWNGNKLKGHSQINIFFIHLDAGKHTLRFIANQSPFLETVRIYQVANEQNVVFEPVKNYQIESGNRRPWLIFILVNLELERLKIQANANQKQGDDDDLQLKINGERQINDTLKSHKYWYWCGRVLKGQSKTFDKKLNLAAGLHYIELWADNTPVLESVEMALIRKDKKSGKDSFITPYTYKGVGGSEDYNRYDTTIETVVDDWNNEFLNQTEPPPTLLDPNLVKAIIYIETRMGYYENEADDYPSYPDIMQVANPQDKAIHVLRDDGKENTEYEIIKGKLKRLFEQEANADTYQESIKWGVRWLYHKAQNNIQEDSNWRREWVSWKEAVLGYGPGTKDYRDKVWKIYRDGIDPQGNKLWSILLPLLLLPALIFSSFALQGKIYITFEDIKGAEDYLTKAHILNGVWFQHLPLAITRSSAGNFLALDKTKPIYVKYLDIDKDGRDEILISGKYLAHFTHYLLKKEGNQYRIVYHNSNSNVLEEAFRTKKIEFLEFKEVEGGPNLEAVENYPLHYLNAPDQLWTTYYFFDPKEGNYKFYKTIKQDLD